jgi:hypothetical protein
VGRLTAILTEIANTMFARVQRPVDFLHLPVRASATTPPTSSRSTRCGSRRARSSTWG